MLLVAQRVAGARVAQPDGGGDVAGVDLVDVFALVGVHAQEAADALALAACVELHTVVPALERARVDAEERQLSANGSFMILNASAAERLVVAARARSTVSPFGIDAVHRRNVERRRQVVHDGVEQRLHALVLERRAAEDAARA